MENSNNQSSNKERGCYNYDNDINIPQLLAEKYPQWIYLTPEVYQIDDDMNIVKTWNNKKEVAEFFHRKIQGLDLSLRKLCRFCGYFWILKVLYDNEGIRPIYSEKRNSPIYAYDPPEFIVENYENYQIGDFEKEEFKKEFRFIGRYPNSVVLGRDLDISVTNIRRVAKKQLLLHKGYYFSFTPLYPIHGYASDILILLEKRLKYSLIEEEIEKLKQLFVDFEKEYVLYDENSTIISSIIQKTKLLVEKYKPFII